MSGKKTLAQKWAEKSTSSETRSHSSLAKEFIPTCQDLGASSPIKVAHEDFYEEQDCRTHGSLCGSLILEEIELPTSIPDTDTDVEVKFDVNQRTNNTDSSDSLIYPDEFDLPTAFRKRKMASDVIDGESHGKVEKVVSVPGGNKYRKSAMKGTITNSEISSSRPEVTISENSGPFEFAIDVEKERAACKAVKKCIELFSTRMNELINLDSGDPRRPKCKFDMAAAFLMRQNKETLNSLRMDGFEVVPLIGSLPGVYVGQTFFYREEMSVIGLHNQAIRGIDYLKAKVSPFGVSVATSVVMSGIYQDDEDNGDTFWYTGQGGNNARTLRQTRDQQCTHGNEALVNSCKVGCLVRVIRGYPERTSKTGKLFSYDGLYRIDRWTEGQGQGGFKVFKFLFRRLSGQPPLVSSKVKYVGCAEGKKGDKRVGQIIDDLSGGLENHPIVCVNNVNDSRPPHFKYVISLSDSAAASRIPVAVPHSGCGCVAGCFKKGNICPCARRHGGAPSYIGDKQLMHAVPAVFECGRECPCDSSCLNRVVQLGIRFRFEVFMTAKKGWGVRSLEAIPAGSFIGEYFGKVITNDEAQDVSDDYLYNLDFILGNQNRRNDVDALLESVPQVLGREELLEPIFCVDAMGEGSFTRFINHSCNPNLFAQSVFYDHHDFARPHIAFFAYENIRPLKELTYDYNYEIDVVKEDGVIKTLACKCGASICRGRMY